jgi:hypothetical protein
MCVCIGRNIIVLVYVIYKPSNSKMRLTLQESLSKSEDITGFRSDFILLYYLSLHIVYICIKSVLP